MGVLSDNAIIGASAAGGVYDIDYSCRFNNPGTGDGNPGTSRLTNTFGAPTNNKLWTFSIWAKRGYLGTDYSDTGVGVTSSKRFFGAKPDGAGLTALHCGWEQDNNLVFRFFDSTDTEYKLSSTARYRDPSAWYHCVFQYNSADGTAANRMKMWVNGEQITALGTANYPPQHTLAGWNENTFLGIVGGVVGNQNTPNYEYGFDGLLAEIHFIDGQGLTAANFGETDEDINQWKAIKYTGTYGNNGFYFEFKNSANFGVDSSANASNWTVASIGAEDQMVDTPTNNWCTFNPVAPMWSTIGNSPTLSEGNLKVVSSASNWRGARSTFVVPKTGKFYCEVYVGGTTSPSYANVSGLVPGIQDNYTDTGAYAWFSNDGTVRYSNSDLTTTTGPATGDIMSWYVNDGEVKIYLNNVLKYTYATNLSAVDDDYFFYTECSGTLHFATVNFGQDSSFAGVLTAQNNDDDGEATADWYYAPPTGVAALCTDNLSDPEIALPEENFKTIKWTGSDGGSRDHTGVGFSPGFVYIKNSSGSAGYSHQWFDTLRGVGKTLRADTSAAELTNNTEGYLDSFDADGFSTLAGSTDNSWTNRASHVYHAWNWRIPTAFSGATAGSGTLKTYTGIKNPEAGMSIVKYTGNGTNGHFIPHGLGKAPELTIIRYLDNSSGTATAEQWEVITNGHFSSVYHTVKLDVSPVQSAQGAGGVINAAPDATHVKLGLNGNTNGNNAVLNMWNFTDIEGYQKIGTFTGNSSIDGTFIYLGFKPSLLWLAPITNVTDGNWNFVSDGENGVTNYNVISNALLIDASSNQNTDNTMDLLSNGFKMRKSSAYWNSTSTKMFYLAIAESPFKYSNGR